MGWTTRDVIEDEARKDAVRAARIEVAQYLARLAVQKIDEVTNQKGKEALRSIIDAANWVIRRNQ